MSPAFYPSRLCCYGYEIRECRFACVWVCMPVCGPHAANRGAPQRGVRAGLFRVGLGESELERRTFQCVLVLVGTCSRVAGKAFCNLLAFPYCQNRNV